ncbi:reverse transcriptase domain-containing protein [Kutzneria buriramensis]|uniref:reverse transcriptase domain-containing protein n=1 Tax=Kutzneria buriramensis TaxID=1045776 RepID=UPI0014769726|nr:reverse transcriptase domain-containing protein [Kutzneria buriramensis]
MGDLLAAAIDPRCLTPASEQVLASDAADDQLSAGVRRFAGDAEKSLADLADLLASGTYQPGLLTEVVIPKDGGHRVLRVPTVPDRVVERDLLSHLRPHLDPVLGPGSFGFRPGPGVVDAVQALARLREEGFGCVLHTDLHDCFPSVDLTRLRRLLGS